MIKQKKFFSLFVVLILSTLVFSGCGLKQGNLNAMRELSQTIELDYWRVFDDSDDFKNIIAEYQALHPNVKINYRKLRYEEYEQAMLEAWAEDRGPDIFSIHNTWVGKYASKIEPMPESVKLAYVTSRNPKTGAVESADYRNSALLTPFDVRNMFTETVYQDTVRAGQVMGLPLSLDTLALFYNRTMLDNAGIIQVPGTWLDMKEAVKKLTIQDDTGDILQSGIALGAADNINRSVDILSLLMMQNGTDMTTSSGRGVVFDKASPYIDDKNHMPGVDATRFYTDFALPSKEVYSWNEDMPDAVSAFVNGKLAFLIGYSYQLPLIKTQGARLNLGVAPIPHINPDGTDALGSQVNFASYWLETVSKKAKNTDYAWDFVKFATSRERAEKFLSTTEKPTALRSLVDSQKADPAMSVFASQVLTARSWYRGRDAIVVEDIMRDVIRNVVKGEQLPEEALQYAAKRINRTY